MIAGNTDATSLRCASASFMEPSSAFLAGGVFAFLSSLIVDSQKEE